MKRERRVRRENEQGWRQTRPTRRASGLVAALLLASLVAGCSSAATHAAWKTPTPLPPTPTLTAQQAAHALADQQLARANAWISSMTLDQELGQLFVVEYLYTDPNHSDLSQMFGAMGAGGVILYHSLNIEGVAQTRQLVATMQAQASIPLIVGVDEEGGGDDQTNTLFGAHPTASQIGATGDPQMAAQNATRIANELKQLGMNTNFAPVVDVEASGRVWTRSFGYTPDLVSKMGAAQIDAYQANGIMACLKHFPGLGAATINPHDGLPVIDSSRAHIEAVDLAPYRALMSHSPAMIMTTDLLMPALDSSNLPAELSPAIVTGILRNEIGYQGVIITDALYMGGITESYSMSEAGVLSIIAGNDMLEGPSTAAQLRSMIAALHAAVQSGRISKARIDDSVRRILLLKAQYGLLPPPPPNHNPVSG